MFLMSLLLVFTVGQCFLTFLLQLNPFDSWKNLTQYHNGFLWTELQFPILRYAEKHRLMQISVTL